MRFGFWKACRSFASFFTTESLFNLGIHSFILLSHSQQSITMARKLFNPRQRAHTTNESVPQPTTFTDAFARSDLQPLGQVSAEISSNTAKRSNTLTVDVARSPQHDGHSTRSSNAPSRPQTSQGPEETHLAEEMIGIALGSPTAAWGMGFVASIPGTMTDMSDTETDQHSTEKSNAPALRRKPSKWKKLGDLFKPKATTVPAVPADTPFYHVKINDQAMLPARYPDFIKDHNTGDSTQNQTVQCTRSDAQKAKTRSPKKHAKLTKGQSPPPQKHWGGMSEEPAQVTAERDPPPTNFLGVDIPDVELERYSVMFGSLLGKYPSPTLLARRSRTLDQLNVQEEERNDEVCTENHGKDMRLPLPRRVTSPAPSKSSFTLFPSTTTTTAAKLMVSHSIPRGPSPASALQGPSPFRRPYTSPLLDDSSGSYTDHSTNHARTESELSILSSAGSEADSLVDDRTILMRFRPPPLIDEKEPEWEIIHRTKPRSPPSLQREKDEEENISTPTTSLPDAKNTGSSPPPTRPPPVPYLNPNPSTLQLPTSSFPPRSSSRCSARPAPSPPEITVDGEPDPEPEPEISIARSISVSKRQKHMLVPISGSVRRVRRGPDERIVERRAGTPTMTAVQKGHAHRKSENVVIESA